MKIFSVTLSLLVLVLLTVGIALADGGTAQLRVIHVSPDEFIEETPYYVAIVELEEGTRVSARLLGYDPLKPEEVKLGSKVKLDYEDGKTGRKYLAFKPA